MDVVGWMQGLTLILKLIICALSYWINWWLILIYKELPMSKSMEKKKVENTDAIGISLMFSLLADLIKDDDDD